MSYKKAEKQITDFIKTKNKTRVEFIPTGNRLLNLCFSQKGKDGGIPRGRIVNFVADGSSGKTLLSLEICRYFYSNIKNIKSKLYPSVKKIQIVYNNVEGVMDLPLEQMYGEDFVNSVEWEQTRTCEEFGRDYMKRVINLKPGTSLLYVVDSLDALIPRVALNRTLKSVKNDTDEEETFPTEKAKYFTLKFFDRLCSLMKDKDVTLIIISQIREKIGVTFGEKYKRVGSKALDFYTHLVVWLAEVEKLKATYKGNTRVYGTKIRAKVKRSKVSKAHREADIINQFDYGVDNISTSINYLYGTANNIKWNKKKFKKKKFIKYLENNPEELNKLMDEVENKWKEIETKTTPQRKLREFNA